MTSANTLAHRSQIDTYTEDTPRLDVGVFLLSRLDDAGNLGSEAWRAVLLEEGTDLLLFILIVRRVPGEYWLARQADGFGKEDHTIQ